MPIFAPKTNNITPKSRKGINIMKTLKTKTAIYQVVVNEDGTLTLTKEYVRNNRGLWVATKLKAVDNAGLLIMSLGGIEGTLARCQDVDAEAYIAELNEVQNRQHAAAERKNIALAQELEAAYEATFTTGKAEANEQNILTLLKFLNTKNWGSWPTLPAMTIGYSVAQHDCGGHICTAIKLDAPVVVGGEPGTQFVVGICPVGYLQNYRRIS